jgi:hypothetical protein
VIGRIVASLATALAAGCATPPGDRGPDFGNADVLKVWREWSPTSAGMPRGTEAVAVRNLACKRKLTSEFVGVEEYKRAFWCSFTFVHRQPDGSVIETFIPRWLVGETERKKMGIR